MKDEEASDKEHVKGILTPVLRSERGVYYMY